MSDLRAAANEDAGPAEINAVRAHRPEPALRPVLAVALSILLAGGLGLMLGGLTPVPSVHLPTFGNPFRGGPFFAADPAGGEWLDRSQPTRVDIEAAEVHAPLVELGLDHRGEFEVPSLRKPHQAGWFKHSATPGEFGPTILLGHVDTVATGPAVFFPLRDLDKGDRIELTRKDGIVVTYQVTKTDSYPKNELPYEEIFGVEPEPVLRLITCGGRFDRGTGDYTENLVVFAAYADHREATDEDRQRPLKGREAFRKQN